MAKEKKVLTAEELEAKHQKAAERRAARKESNMEAINEIVSLLTEEQVKALSDGAKKLIAVLRQEYAARSVYVPQEGDTLAQIMSKHPNISAKKLAKKCEEAGLVVDWAKGMLVKAA